MTAVQLPALDGREPLGFLAALGALRLLDGARLSFNPTTAIATLHGPYGSVHEIAAALTAVLDSIADGAAIPGVPAGFPRPMQRTGSDPTRVARDRFPALARDIAGSPDGPRWLSSLITDLVVDDKGLVACTPYMAPSGKQSVYTFFAKPLEATRTTPDRILEALTGWRRLDNFSGEYLDHRVLSSAADHPSGTSTEAGVPGATWLATMALPLLRVTGSGTGTKATATGWHHVPGRHAPVMVWPLWRNPLSPAAVETLLQHPALRPQQAANNLHLNPAPLTELGIFHVAAAERQPVEGRKFAGVLTPRPITMALPDQQLNNRHGSEPQVFTRHA
jgi:hypothetical protein